MQVIQSENVIMYDVDDTLVLWDVYCTPLDEVARSATLTIVDPYDNNPVRVRPHTPHIKLLKNHKARGKTVIVWSQGGFEWARAVVMALGLQNYVDFVMSKPRAYVDDLPAAEWLKDRIFISPESNWGKGLKEGNINEYTDSDFNKS